MHGSRSHAWLVTCNHRQMHSHPQICTHSTHTHAQSSTFGPCFGLVTHTCAYLQACSPRFTPSRACLWLSAQPHLVQGCTGCVSQQPRPATTAARPTSNLTHHCPPLLDPSKSSIQESCAARTSSRCMAQRRHSELRTHRHCRL